MYRVEHHHSNPLDGNPAYYWHFYVVVDEHGQPYEFANYALATFIKEDPAKEFCNNLNQPKVIDYDERLQ